MRAFLDAVEYGKWHRGVKVLIAPQENKIDSKQYTAAQVKELWENSELPQNLNDFVKNNFVRVMIVGRPNKMTHQLYELKKGSPL